MMDASPSFLHLSALSDDNGIFEHALLDEPRRDHGYCVDDVARALIVVTREREQTTELARLGEIYLRFLERALRPGGLSHNRMDEHGRWTDAAAMGDWWGRSLWALGTTAVHGHDPISRARARRAFDLAAQERSRDLRTTAFAALGAAEIVAVDPGHEPASAILRDLVASVPTAQVAEWPWPEHRLRYANAAIPEALIAAGTALRDEDAVARGLQMLAFLVTLETTDGMLSVTGSRGRGQEDPGPLYAQQPIEVAALADACARALAETGDPAWLVPIEHAWNWFTGHNDVGAVMFDPEAGAGFDGLERHGRNENRGAESTIAALSTFQQVRRLGLLVTA